MSADARRLALQGVWERIRPTPDTLDNPSSLLPFSTLDPLDPELGRHHVVIDAAATALLAPQEDAQKNRHGPLRPSREQNRAGAARTPAIAAIFTTYIYVVRRCLPPLRSSPGLPDLIFVFTVSSSSIPH
ncbi:hypothetical protein TRIUR3_33496 [Triticum urartu]|uniref:Uncharacterized protein n=1 Tax=Triticum urartu TaxID=4572 RepID=M7ZSJ1_TRIUA|nr:hypothetical protein TRIUR3_33496 [Triticum urartu]